MEKHYNKQNMDSEDILPQYDHNSEAISPRTPSRTDSIELQVSKPRLNSSTSSIKHVHILQDATTIIPNDDERYYEGDNNKSNNTLHKSAQQELNDENRLHGDSFHSVSDHPPTPKKCTFTEDAKSPQIDDILQKSVDMDTEPRLRDIIAKNPIHGHKNQHYHEQDDEKNDSIKHLHNNKLLNRNDDTYSVNSLRNGQCVLNSIDSFSNIETKPNQRKDELSWVSELTNASRFGTGIDNTTDNNKLLNKQLQDEPCHVDGHKSSTKKKSSSTTARIGTVSANTSPTLNHDDDDDVVNDEREIDNDDTATVRSAAVLSVAATTPLLNTSFSGIKSSSTALPAQRSPLSSYLRSSRSIESPSVDKNHGNISQLSPHHSRKQINNTQNDIFQHNVNNYDEDLPHYATATAATLARRSVGNDKRSSGVTLGRVSQQRNSQIQRDPTVDGLFGAPKQDEHIPHYMTPTKSYARRVHYQQEEQKLKQETQHQPRQCKVDSKDWQPVEIPQEIPNYMLPTKSYQARISKNQHDIPDQNNSLFRQNSNTMLPFSLSSTAIPSSRRSSISPPQQQQQQGGGGCNPKPKHGVRATDEQYHQDECKSYGDDHKQDYPLNDGVHNNQTCENSDKFIKEGKVVKLFKNQQPQAASNTNEPEGSMFDKTVVIDCKGHLLGRVAALAAKELLNGQKLVFVRAEELNISGSLQRNIMLRHHVIRKRMNTNHLKGPFHFSAPSRYLFKTIRGMIPYKTTRGKEAMARLNIYEGVPPPYQKVKLQVIPGALTVIRLKPHRKFTRLGDLAAKFGWAHGPLLAKLETKRKVAGKAYYKAKLTKQKVAVAKVAAKAEKVQEINQQLAKYGF